ncbi:DNA-binding transcriptional regulator, IscR family [Sphingomonas gellani]|uniref:DNA-binding transcriptional regulator, IscR family n=1 Tax=Sphingomonas gellani TaxID=1166340 RepID=A0A1H8CV89_9SPHN|nr:Rrf2 family transcriptional regulator [Sphingomonas gellani]SEM99141.1 DNA-binding transcriptional regulator, IscR family [Sphingomonas gellani]
MSSDVRLSSVLHLLLHLADADGPVTSEAMARAMGSNAVVARRTLAGLRDAGIVHSVKGHGGGWSLARNPDEVTLRMVYEALGAPRIFAFGNRSERPDCLVEQAVNAELDDARRQAEAVLLTRMAGVTLSALARNFDTRLSALGMDRSDIGHG